MKMVWLGGVLLVTACSGQVASSDPASQSQALTTTDATTSAAPPPGPPPHHGPPPEAFTACEGKAANDACSVTLHGTAEAGTCVSPPPGVSDTRLACRPDRMPEGGGRPPHAAGKPASR